MNQSARAFALAAFLAVAPARAALPIQLDFDGCLVERDEVRHLIELELRASLIESSPAGVTIVRLRCDPDSSLVNVQVDDPVTGKTLGRTVDLLALGPAGATRLLALAIIELISASWLELEMTPRPVAQPVGPRASIEVQSAALAQVRMQLARPRRRVQLGALGIVDALFAGTGPLAGGGVRLVPELPRGLALPIDLVEQHGERSFALGQVAVDALSGDVGLSFRRDWLRGGVRAGAGVRGGAVRFAGQPSSADVVGVTVWVPWIAPLASVSGLWVPTPRLALELIVEGGYALAPLGALVAQTNQVYFSGPWVGAALSVGLFVGR